MDSIAAPLPFSLFLSFALKSIKEIDARFNNIESADSIMRLPRLEQLLLGHNAVTKFKGNL